VSLTGRDEVRCRDLATAVPTKENTRVHDLQVSKWNVFPDGKDRSQTITLSEYKRLCSERQASETDDHAGLISQQ
jgi:hypothetical protein